MGVLTPSISSSAVSVYEGSLQIDDSISAVSTLMCKIRDDAGTNHYTKGQPITLSDSLSGLLYSGFISTATEDRESPNPLIKTDIGARDNHYLAEKRTYDGPDFINMPAGAIFCQLLNTLSQEGITAKYASRRDTTASDFNAGTLSSVTGAPNVGDGDLELSLAGSTVTTTENTTSQFNSGTLTNMQGLSNMLQLSPISGIRLYGQGIQSGGNNYLYQLIWSGSYSIVSGDFLQYDVWVRDDSPQIEAGVDGICSDGSTLRDFTDGSGHLVDQNGLSCHPSTDLSGFANGQWYTRTITLRNTGKTLSTMMVAFEGDNSGYYTAYFKNIVIMNGATTKLTVFSTSATALQSTGNVSNSNYINPQIGISTVYASSGNRIAAGNSLTSVGIASSSFLSWNASAPTGTEVHVDTSMDSGATWLENQNHAAILTILAGMKLASVSLYTRVRMLITGKEPIVTPTMSSLVSTVYSSWSMTKTDVQAIYGTQTQLNIGTISNTKTNSPGSVTLNGFWRNWNTGDISNQTLWGTGTPGQFVTGGQFGVNCTNGGTSPEVRSQLGFAGNWQNFTLDVDLTVGTNGQTGIVYRTTNWNNATNTYAWIAEVSPTQCLLGYGSNSGSSGTYTNVATASISPSLSSGLHHVQLIINGTSHQVFVDGVRYVNATNSTYNQSGGVALRFYNTVSGTHTAWFDNFGIVAALTGTWQSPAIAISGATTAGYNGVYYNIDTSAAGSSISMQVSYDLSTWYTVNNGDPLPTITYGQSLSGKSVYIRATLTAADASGTPTLDAASLIQTQQMNASGNRISPTLSLSTVGRLGGSAVAWNSILPSGCTLGVDARVDAGAWVDVTSSNGGAIPGLNAQPNPTNDSFATDTHLNYTSTFATGGAAVTSATFDTANSRLLLTGGTNALYISNAPTGVGDMEMFVDMDESDVGGLVFHFIDGNNFYDVVIRDGASPASTNTITLFRTLTGTRTQVAQATSINFIRGTYHRFKVNMTGSVITVYMDGIQMLTYTDSTPVGAGKCGMRNDTAAKISRYYQINIQPQGDDVSSHTVQTQLRLASTNPLATPQVSDLILTAFGTTIAAGSTIPQTDFFHKYMDKNIDSLAKASNYWYYFDKNRVAYFLPMNGIPAPWVASDGGSPVSGVAQGDFLDTPLTVEDASDLYRNRQIIENVLASVTINETRKGDGASTSWTFGEEWAGAPTITVNSVAASVGVKNVDTGKQFYYAVGDNTIIEDSSGPTYDASFSITFTGPGQYLTYSQADDTAGQAARAALEGIGTGIVTNVEDGTGLTKAQGDALAQDRLNQYSVSKGRLLRGTTRRGGLAPGQLLSVFLPAHNIWDGLFLIRQISTRFTTEGPTGSMIQQGWYTLECISGPDVGSWEKLYQRSTP